MTATLVPLTAPLEARFDAKVDKSGECWLWTGATNSKSYGIVSDGGRLFLAHRVSYERHVGPIPEGMPLDHLCSNRRCVNPAHLEPVTTAENNRRSIMRRALASTARSRMVF